MLFNLILTAGSIAAFIIYNKKTSFFGRGTYYSVIIFILLSIIGGRVLNFYTIIPFWDKMLHFLSGFILASVANSIYLRLGGNPGNRKLKLLFILLFAVASAGVWEIYEFCGDLLLGLSSQGGSLTDTMLDIIAGSTSGLIYVFLDKKPGPN